MVPGVETQHSADTYEVLSKYDFLSLPAQPLSSPPLTGTVKNMTLNAQGTASVYQCISAAQNPPVLMETPAAFTLSALGSTYSWAEQVLS